MPEGRVNALTLEATAKALERLHEELPALIHQVQALGAGHAVAGLLGVAPWADDIARDLRSRATLVRAIEAGDVGFAGAAGFDLMDLVSGHRAGHYSVA